MDPMRALVDLYDALDADPKVDRGMLPEYGFTAERVALVLELDRDGTLVAVREFEDPKKPGRAKSRQMQVPAHSARSSSIRPFFLCDTLAYLLPPDAYDPCHEIAEAKRAKSERRHAASVDYHHEMLADLDDEAARAVLLFLEDADPTSALSEDDKKTIQENGSSYAVFALSGSLGYVHEHPAEKNLWKRAYAAPSIDDVIGQDAVTGKVGPLARLFPMVSGISGANSMGASLVSFNRPAFESARKQTYNASLTKETAEKAGAAFRYLYRAPGHKMQLGDSQVLWWTNADDEAVGEFFAQTMGARPAEDEGLRQRVGQMLRDARAGRPIEGVPGDAVVSMMSITPSNARLALRWSDERTLDELASAQRAWADDLSMENVRTPTVRDVIRQTAAFGEIERAPDTMWTAVTRASLRASPFPHALYAAVLGRIRNDHNGSKPWDRGQRAAILRGCLVRQDRKTGREKGVPMALDRGNDDPGYVMGRLLAIAEQTQRAVNRSVKSTVSDRYMASASTTPAHVLPAIMRNYEQNMSALRKKMPGYAVNIGREFDGAASLLDGSNPLPRTLDERQQGLFYIGYHQQREAFFAPKKTNGGESGVGAEPADEYEDEEN